jgi:hypothetical protein
MRTCLPPYYDKHEISIYVALLMTHYTSYQPSAIGRQQVCAVILSEERSDESKDPYSANETTP